MSDGKLKIAVLAWGSLIWDDRPEFDERREPWSFDGPILKVEFSRISESRQGALTLVIDEKNGEDVTVAWCLSKRQCIEDAICDLRCREGTTLKNIGCVRLPADPSAPQAAPRNPITTITDWASMKKLDAVIWTALRSNFREKTWIDFSPDAAVKYIKTLDPCGKAKAAEYVWRAPTFVQTKVRNMLQQEPWFSQA
jgi:hypothetical protein